MSHHWLRSDRDSSQRRSLALPAKDNEVDVSTESDDADTLLLEELPNKKIKKPSNESRGWY
jgi:hypothetical protein